MRASLCAKSLLAVALALMAPRLCAQDGLDLAVQATGVGASLGASLTIADFDGDHKPDAAVLLDSGLDRRQTRFRIEVHFSTRPTLELRFESADAAFQLAARDVNHDGFPDVVIEQVTGRKYLHVWLNDRHGGFAQARMAGLSPAQAPAGERVNWPLHSLEDPVASLPSHRRVQRAILRAAAVSARPPSGDKSKSTALPVCAPCRPHALRASRAPPRA